MTRAEPATAAFLDANILFSATLGGESFRLLWQVAAAGRLRLCTSAWCYAEAERNVAAKRPDRRAALQAAMQAVVLVADVAEPHPQLCAQLPIKDAPVLAAALAARAQYLLTGDTRHFGALMARDDLPLRVCTVRQLLLAGP